MTDIANQSINGQVTPPGQPAVGAAPISAASTAYLGQLLNRLRGKHPVFLFGSHEAGKSFVLLSLFQYAQRGDKADFTVTLGEDILPKEAPDAENRNAAAAGFFNRSVKDVLERNLLSMTQIPIGQPVYFPIDVTVPSESHQDLPSVQLVVLDGMGEWFARDPASPRFAHKPFPVEIDYVLRYFAGPISAIFVVPATASPADPLEADMHQAASAAMERYQQSREMHEDDNVLLLATKWDRLHPPNRLGGNFENADSDAVIASLKPVGTAWQSFKTLRNVPVGSRSLLQYSAAWINSGTVMEPQSKAVPVFERYSRTLWNWLYGNATQSTVDGLRSRKVLFSDVEAPPPPKVGFIEWTVLTLSGSRPRTKKARSRG